jgi:hypothetical protein
MLTDIAGMEAVKVIFDYGLIEPATFINTIDVNVVVESGDDPDPASHILRLPLLMDSQATGAPRLAVRVLLGNMLADVVYLIRCTVEMLDGRRIMLQTRLPDEG